MSQSREPRELEIVRRQLAEAHATLDAIRRGEVDAVMVDLGDDQQVFTLQNADLPYREFIEQMAEGALSLDRSHTILYCNRFLCELLGVGREALIGECLLEWLDSASRHAFEGIVDSGEPGSMGAALLRPDGDSVPVRLAVAPAGTNRRRTSLVVTDQRTNRRLQHVTEARDAAEAASSAKDRFLAVLGHELRNPLAALTSSVALLQGDTIDQQRRQWLHDSMARQLAQLRSLVDDLLDLTRVAQGKIVLRKEKVSLAAVVSEAIEVVEGIITERGHTLVIEDIPTPLVVEADRTRLEQIIVNLLSNAAKYTARGGTITVVVRADDATVSLSVIDDGIGLEAEHLEHIFAPFAQIGEEGMGGLGIGLTLVRQLVELHGGTIQAFSEGAGRGTTFRIRLPRSRAHTPTPVPATPPGPQLPAGLRVLVVDDNEDAADILSILLESRGLLVNAVYRGEDVLEAVREHDPGLVLLDLGLPDLSGYEVSRQLRDAGFERTVIVALTGFSHEDARSRVADAGFDDHVVKPITLERLASLFEQFHDRMS